MFVCPGLSPSLPNYVVLASVFAVAATLVVIVSHQNLLTLISKSRGNVISNARILIASQSMLVAASGFLLL